MSINNGVAPVISIAATVATAVWETVTTEQPEPMSRARKASAMASVPLPQPITEDTPSQAANSASKARSSLPRMYQPEDRAQATASSISDFNARYPAPGFACGIIGNPTTASCTNPACGRYHPAGTFRASSRMRQEPRSGQGGSYRCQYEPDRRETRGWC